MNSKTRSSKFYSWIELDRAAFSHNIQELYTMRGPAKSLGLVVKANAYGHGLEQVAQCAEYEPLVTHLFVASLEEALLVHQLHTTKRIVVLVGVPGDLVSWAIKQSVEFVVYSFNFLQYLLDQATCLGFPVRVHIKLDTGLGRLGFVPSQVARLIDILIQHKKYIILEGCMTHYAQSGRADILGMQMQRSRFHSCLEQFSASGLSFNLYHAAASGGYLYMAHGLENFARVGTFWTGCEAPSSGEKTIKSADVQQENFARIGTSWTGLWKSQEHKKAMLEQYPDCSFKPVLTWFARIMHIAMLPKGSAVGYQGSFVTKRDSRIAVIPVGYSDGYPRSLSNTGKVCVDASGTLVPVVGLVSMNMLSIDVTNCPEVQVGDIVRVLGGVGRLSFTECAESAGMIALDMMTGISPLLPRVISER